MLKPGVSYVHEVRDGEGGVEDESTTGLEAYLGLARGKLWPKVSNQR